MLAPFEATRLKIARAERHLQELRDEIDRYFARGGTVVMCEGDVRFLPDVVACLTLRVREPIPDLWSSIVGDIVHNLRSSLDLLASDLVRIYRPGASLKGVYFPFCDTQHELAGAIVKREMHKCCPAVTAAIEHVAPYRGGNDGLRALHDLDITDKHTAIVPVVSIAKIPAFDIRFGGHTNPIPEWSAQVGSDGQRMLVLPLAWSPYPIGSKVNADFEILFGADAGLFEGRGLLHQLDACVVGVKEIAKLFRDIVDMHPPITRTI